MLRHVDSADGSRTVLQVTPDTRAHFLKSAFHAEPGEVTFCFHMKKRRGSDL